MATTYKKFTKEQRSSFAYWYWHWKAFNDTAKEYGMWRIKYLFHDIEKPFLRLIWPYEKVQKWHRTHNAHHLEYKGDHDWDAMFIDWECSHLTKEQCPRNAVQEAKYMYEIEGKMDKLSYLLFMNAAHRILKNYEYKKVHTS